jgi:hypothetical protein
MTYMPKISAPGFAASFDAGLQQPIHFPFCDRHGTERPAATWQRLVAHWEVDPGGRLVCVWTLDWAPALSVPPD